MGGLLSLLLLEPAAPCSALTSSHTLSSHHSAPTARLTCRCSPPSPPPPRHQQPPPRTFLPLRLVPGRVDAPRLLPPQQHPTRLPHHLFPHEHRFFRTFARCSSNGFLFFHRCQGRRRRDQRHVGGMAQGAGGVAVAGTDGRGNPERFPRSRSCVCFPLRLLSSCADLSFPHVLRLFNPTTSLRYPDPHLQNPCSSTPLTFPPPASPPSPTSKVLTASSPNSSATSDPPSSRSTPRKRSSSSPLTGKRPEEEESLPTMERTSRC